MSTVVISVLVTFFPSVVLMTAGLREVRTVAPCRSAQGPHPYAMRLSPRADQLCVSAFATGRSVTPASGTRVRFFP